MTRKRCKKLLMSIGYSRNEAEKIIKRGNSLNFDRVYILNALEKWIDFCTNNPEALEPLWKTNSSGQRYL